MILILCVMDLQHVLALGGNVAIIGNSDCQQAARLKTVGLLSSYCYFAFLYLLHSIEY